MEVKNNNNINNKRMKSRSIREVFFKSFPFFQKKKDMLLVILAIISIVLFFYLVSQFNTNIRILKTPLKLQCKVDEWNKIYENVDISSFNLGNETRNKRITFFIMDDTR